MYGRGHLINQSNSNPGVPMNLNSNNPTPDSCRYIFKSGHCRATLDRSRIRIIFDTSRRGTEFAVSNLPPPPGGSVATERQGMAGKKGCSGGYRIGAGRRSAARLQIHQKGCPEGQEEDR